MIDVSVIMTVYNCDEFLDQSIRSILNQSFSNFEFIIINDGSTDKSLSIIENYSDKDSRIISIHNSKNLGISHCSNIAINLARGRYIARMDADDLSHLDRLRRQVQYMDQNENIVASGTYIQTINKTGNKETIFKYPTDPDIATTAMLFNFSIANPSSIFRNDVVKGNHITFDERWSVSEDYLFFSQLSKYGKISNIGTVLLYYRLHNNNISRSKRHEIDDGANKVRIFFLEHIGIEMKNDDLDLFLKVCNFNSTVDCYLESKLKLDNLFKNIEDANQCYNFFNKKSLSLLLKKYYSEFFARSKKNSVTATLSYLNSNFSYKFHINPYEHARIIKIIGMKLFVYLYKNFIKTG